LPIQWFHSCWQTCWSMRMCRDFHWTELCMARFYIRWCTSQTRSMVNVDRIVVLDQNRDQWQSRQKCRWLPIALTGS
jgi:hypothetical protein